MGWSQPVSLDHYLCPSSVFGSDSELGCWAAATALALVMPVVATDDILLPIDHLLPVHVFAHVPMWTSVLGHLVSALPAPNEPVQRGLVRLFHRTHTSRRLTQQSQFKPSCAIADLKMTQIPCIAPVANSTRRRPAGGCFKRFRLRLAHGSEMASDPITAVERVR